MKIILVICLLAALSWTGQAQFDANCFGTRRTIVHLFEWRWDDIAQECERFLAPKGYCGVQVSPPNENRVVMLDTEKRPWWERYQPVSYKTYSRSGDEAAFRDMVTRCNNVGVRIYVDAIMNHMAGSDAGAGVGIGGSSYNAATQDFPGVPYSSQDFNQKGVECHSGSGNIENYGDENQVRNCWLVSLTDLKQSKSYVREKLVEWLNELIAMGVAGFRFDAAKHMWPSDMQTIFNQLDTLSTTWFSSGTRPFLYQEVIDLGGEPIKSADYYGMGRVTEFNYGKYVSEAFNGQNQLKNLKTFGEGWGYLMPDEKALSFIDNHDNQRGHGGGGSILSFKSSRKYKMAVTYMLAWPYGVTRVMSSYSFDTDWRGPPADSFYNTLPVTINNDGSCGNDWICEHRWRPIANMAGFRNNAGSESVENWWDDGDNQIAFSRGSKAFFVMNGGSRTLSATLQTGLRAGRYCDVISGERAEDQLSCTGNSVLVGSDGRATFSISSSAEEPMVAIHIDSILSGDIGDYTDPPAPTVPTAPPAEGYQRTVVFIQYSSTVGQNLFLRGGVSSARRPACDISPSACHIPIRYSHVSYSSSHYAAYNAWSSGDTYLDWTGAQAGQGTYMSSVGEGSPMAWTTNAPTSDSGYNELNTYGSHYWMWDVEMDCSSTDDGWFELKAILNNAWEQDITQSSSCSGTSSLSAPFVSNNHIGRCGYKNVFVYGSNSCKIDNF